MDTYRILLDGAEVASISGDSLELGQCGTEADPKCIKRTVHGQCLFVLMASTMKNVTVVKDAESQQT